MTQKQSYIIYFKKSSNTRVPPFREVQIVMMRLSQIELSQREIDSWLLWTKGLMLTPKWAALALLTLHWPTLIWVTVCLTRTTHMLSSRNCIDTFYYSVKVRIVMYKSVDMPKLQIYIYWGTSPKYKLQ